MKRLLLGILIGLVIGGFGGYGVLQLGVVSLAGPLAYAFAAATGVVVGLVAGKPIWAKGAAVEAGLKAVIGAMLGCAILFGLRFVHFAVPALGPIHGGDLASHPIAALAAVATVLAVLYELDNSGDDETVDKNAPTRKRIAAPPATKANGASAEPLDEEEHQAKQQRR